MPIFKQPRRPKPPDQLWDLMTSTKSGNPETIRRKAGEMGRDLNRVYIGGNTLLTKAIQDNEAPSTVKAIITAGAYVDYPNSKGETALMIAVKVKSPKLMKVLIEYGADPQLKTMKCISAISLCLKIELYSYLKILLRQGMNNVYFMCENLEEICFFLRETNQHQNKKISDIGCPNLNVDPKLISTIKNMYDVNIKDMNGTTPLMYAVRCHYDDCVRLLMLVGADVNRINKSKETALTLAMARSHNPILKDLIRARALRRHPRDKTSTLTFGMFKIILDYLQQNGLFNTPDIYGKTALMYAVGRGDKESIMYAFKMDIEERVKAKFLLDSIYKTSQCVGDGYDSDSVSTLCAANETEKSCRNSDKQALEDRRKYKDIKSRPVIMGDFLTGQMLEELFGGKANICDKCGDSTVIYAIRYCDFLTEEITKLLVGDTHKEQYQDGRTALMIAVSGYNGGSHTYIEPLIGDSCSIQDKDGKTALMYALINSLKIPENVLQLMIGDSQNIQDNEGKTALMYALIHSEGISVNTLQLMIGDSQKMQDNEGKTALMYALIKTKKISKNVLQMMIGDSQNVQDIQGRTALIYAFMHNKQLSEELICHLAGQTPFIQDDTGKTALMYAFKGNQYLTYSSIQKLFGGKVDIRDNEGKTQLIYAFKYYTQINEEIANLLVGDTHRAQYEHGKTALMIALENNKNLNSIHHFIQSLIDCLCDVQDNSGQTALMYAMRHNCHLPEHLFEQMIRQSQFIQDNEGKTALMHAYQGSYSLNTLIIKLFHRDALNIQDYEGKTALHHAIEHDQAVEHIEQLILHGSNLEIEDKQKRTAFVTCLQFDAGDTVSLYQWGNNFMKTKMLLRYNQMPILGLLGKQIILKYIKKGLFSLYSLFNNKEIFRLMIVNGIVPFPYLREKMSTFFAILQENLIDVLKYLIANMYLTTEDFMMLIKAKNYLNSHEFPRKKEMYFNGYYLNLRSPDLQHMITEVTSQPWPLVKLSFIVVSSALGHGTNREDRVNRLPLPNPIKDSLMFNTRTALIPVSEWSNIPMVFDPVEYENTRRLRPLLNYWPFVAELVV